MENTIIKIRLVNNYGGNYQDTYQVLVYWDDTASTLNVKTLDSSGNFVALETSGPDLGQLQVNQVQGVTYDSSSVNRLTGQINPPKFFYSNYKFCDSLTLNTFQGLFNNPSFPYATQIETLNAAECGVNVCDLHFTGIPSIVNPSNSASIDGSFTVTANSSHGTVEFSESDLPYGQGNNTTGSFTALSAGQYRIYARDQYNCRATVDITLVAGAAFTTDTKYRIDYKDLNGNDSRIDIVQTGFNGTATELVCSGMPILITKPSGTVNDKFQILNPTSATVGLTSVTNFQYIGLFSQDDRRYQVKFYKGADLFWTGFVIPSVYQEAYINPPYTINLVATDGIQQLQNLDFLDDTGNKLTGSLSIIKLIAFVFKKLGLSLSFRVALNMYASGFSTGAANDPLDQTYINDLDSFYEDDGTAWKCDRVIEAILAPFGAKIVQAEGYWNIIHIEEQTDNYDYRVFSSTGTYVSNSTSDHIIDINSPSLAMGALFRDRNQTLQIVPAYGDINLSHTLDARKNLLKSGSFELEDWDGQFFIGWGININGAAGVTYGVKQIVLSPGADLVNDAIRRTLAVITNGTNGITRIPFGGRNLFNPRGSHALYIANIEQSLLTGHTGFVRHGGTPFVFAGLGKNVYITSPTTYLDFLNDSVTISFKYRINLHQYGYNDGLDPHWVRVRYQVECWEDTDIYVFNEKLGWLRTTGSGTLYPDSNEFYNTIYETNFNSDQSKELTINLPDAQSFQTAKPLTIRFWFEGVTSFDAMSFVDLQAILTVDRTIGNKAKVAVTDTIYYYNLRAGTDATSSPSILRPGDYNALTNPVVWELEHSDRYYGVIQEIYMDDVVLLFNPGYVAPPQSEELSILINDNFKETLDVSIATGDLPDTQIDSGRYIYENYFQDSVGTPTTGWKRDYIDEATTVQKILLKSLANQYSKPTFKLGGAIYGKTDLTPLSVLRHTQDPASIVVANQDFATGGSWSNTGGADWAITGGQAVYTYATGTFDNDNYFIQTGLTLPAGSRISISVSVTRSGANTSRSDVLYCVLMDGANVVQKVALTQIIKRDGTATSFTRFNIGQDCDTIGFFIYTLDGLGNVVYSLDYFTVTPLTVIRLYEISSYTYEDKMNKYDVELLQLIPPVANPDPTIDNTGGGDIDGTLTGGAIQREHSSAFSEAFS